MTPTNQLTFDVSLDGSAFAAATSPASYSSLALGDHTFKVESFDQAGNTSSTVSYTWTISPTVTTGSISGKVFQDNNTNGVQNTGEPGLAGITVFLDLKKDGTLDPGDPTATTNASGLYTFSTLTPGTYTRRLGFCRRGVRRSARPRPGSYQVSVSSGSSTLNQNFRRRPY